MTVKIERAHYIALRVENAEAAANFAVEKMGFNLTYKNGSDFYLEAGGVDPYSLVYKEGEPGIDHISYLVKDKESLMMAEESLIKSGVEIIQRVSPSEEWMHREMLRFKAPGDNVIELTVGVHVDNPVGHITSSPSQSPGVISLDHVVSRIIDTETAEKFWTEKLGLKLSSKIVDPNNQEIMSFYRCHTLFHCFAMSKSDRLGLHHYQMTLKDSTSLWEAYEYMKDNDVDIIWGPLRHGPGHNIAFYFLDYGGNIVEYSCEEEVILDNDAYTPRIWSITDPKANDEWNSTLPPKIFM